VFEIFSLTEQHTAWITTMSPLLSIQIFMLTSELLRHGLTRPEIEDNRRPSLTELRNCQKPDAAGFGERKLRSPAAHKEIRISPRTKTEESHRIESP
jgi:hypothetical protein